MNSCEVFIEELVILCELHTQLRKNTRTIENLWQMAKYAPGDKQGGSWPSELWAISLDTTLSAYKL